MKLHHGLLTISDFAAYCGTTRQTLQYYDRIGLLKPIKLGEQGYRYYHPLQSHEVRMIRSFQGSGSSLDEVKEILNFSSLDALDNWISVKQEAFAQELKRIKREMEFLSRYRAFLKLARDNPLEVPTLFTFDHPIRFHVISFDEPVELYSEYYFDILVRYSEYCKAHNTIQEYPFYFYVSEAEMRGELRFSKMLCMPEDMQTQTKDTLLAPSGQVLMMRCHPDRNRKEDNRKYAYETMFRFLKEHGLRSFGGCLEQPMPVPPGLRNGDYHFTVVFFMPVKPDTQDKERGGET